jgi:hypothetical protein
MLSFLILNFVIVIRRRQTPHVKETTEDINNKIYNGVRIQWSLLLEL